ncbi:dimethylsulfonioproprionate lyase family protein [Planktotalea sp.]|uniref:dimethylsulfonioproprionate lyase family protein n=1 Tax=Planktotalea sp. TaxID=2029877 RepID=UPI0035C7F4DC
MTYTHLEIALKELRTLHSTHAELSIFCPFPDDVTRQPRAPYSIPATELFAMQDGLDASAYSDLRDALRGLGSDMLWRETYNDSDTDPDFMNRFGCYEIIGRDAPFRSKKMRGFLVFQPPHLHYPWHHHSADEIYVVIAGEAEFFLQGAPSQTLQSGQSAFHPSGAAHALTRHAHPVIAYVVWRDDFDVAPVWSTR